MSTLAGRCCTLTHWYATGTFRVTPAYPQGGNPMVAEGRRPQVWVQLEPDTKAQLERLARRAGVSVSELAGLWVRRGLAGAYSGTEGLSPTDQVLVDRLTDLASRVPPALAQQAVWQAHAAMPATTNTGGTVADMHWRSAPDRPELFIPAAEPESE